MTDKKITICFVLPDLSRGGAQRIMSFVAANLDKSKFQCTLLIVSPQKETDFKVKGIVVKYLNKKRVLYAVFSLFYFLASKRFDIVIGSIGHINKLLAFYSYILKKSKFIGREASLDTILSKHNKTNHASLMHSFFNDYRIKFNALICQSQDMSVDAISAYKLDQDKVYIINNPLTIQLPKSLSKKPVNEIKQLITIGRLSKEKGHERIINLLDKIDLKWHYTIIGSGPEDENIINQIKYLNLEQDITIIPHIDNVNELIPHYDLFLQGSFVEGFPNATMESCALGTPVLAFNAPGGTKEIIINDVNGFIANSEEDFLNLINKALTEKKWDPQVISNSVTEKFHSETILSEYKNLFINLLNK
jgi:glycosyltransferase involved in cell wall biosynthesis